MVAEDSVEAVAFGNRATLTNVVANYGSVVSTIYTGTNSYAAIQMLNGASSVIRVKNGAGDADHSVFSYSNTNQLVLGADATTISLPKPIVYGGVTFANTVTGSGSLVGATSPSISDLTVTSSLTATGLVGLPALATQATNTVVGNATSGSASPTALAMTSCSTSASAVKWTTNTGFGCNTAINAATVTNSGSVVTAVYTGTNSFAAIQMLNGANSVIRAKNGAGNADHNIFSYSNTDQIVLGTDAASISLLKPIVYGGVTLSNSVTGTLSMVLSNSPTFTGTVGAADITATGTIRANTAISANGSAGQSATATVRDSAGTGTCTLIFTFGIKTGGTC